MKTTRIQASTGLDLTADEGVERPEPDKAPSAFRIWRSGRNDTDKGPVVVTEGALASVLEAQKTRGNLYSIDYDHQSLVDGAPPAARVAAGWHRLAARDGELWAVDVEWAPLAKSQLEQRPPGFRYFSPAYDVDTDSRVLTRYLNMAVTNNPATWNVTALAAATGEKTVEDDKNKEPAVPAGGVDLSAIVAALHKIATEGSGEEKARALAALKALMPNENEQATEGEDDKGDKPPPSEKREGQANAKASKANTTASITDPALAAVLTTLSKGLADIQGRFDSREKRETEERAKAEATERANLAARKGLAAELATLIKDPKTSIETARVLANIGGGSTRLGTTETVTGTRPATAGERGTMSDPQTVAFMDQKMGLAKSDARPRMVGVHQEFPVMMPEQARKLREERKAAATATGK